MPKHVRSIGCCYCGASTLVNLQKPSPNSLKCRECGAGMSACKMAHVYQPCKAAGWSGEAPSHPAPKAKSDGERKLAKEWQGKREWRKDDDDDDDDDDDRRKKSKRKKKKGLLDRLEDRLEDLWDDVEDIFD